MAEGSWRRHLSARGQILGWMLLLVTLALLVSVVTTREVLLRRVDDRVNVQLTHEADKFRAFAADGTDPTTGGRYRSVDELLSQYLRQALPEEHEAYFTIVAGVPHQRSAARPPARLDTDTALVRRLARATSPEYGTTTSSAGAVRYAVLPVRMSGDPRPAQLVVLEFADLERREVDDSVGVFTVVGVVALLAAGLVGWLIASRVLAPVRLLRQTAEHISGTDLTARIEVTGHDDVAELARTVNRMLDRLAGAFEAQRRFVNDAGHELRTPITVVRGHLELMGDDPAERAETLRLVTDELDRMRRIVDDLVVLAAADRPDFLHLDQVEIADLTVEVVAKARALGERLWLVDEVAEVTVRADGQRLTQALIQLVANAVAHTEPGDVVAVGSRVDGATLRLWVRDGGSGVDPADAPHIFERFSRGRDRRGPGAGLGLAIVRVIAETHGGSVALVDDEAPGARFELALPIEEEPSPRS